MPNLESSKFWSTAITLLMYGIMEFIFTIHSESYGKIDGKITPPKTGGVLYFSLASTSPDMTQPADNINMNTTRHLSTTVIHYNGVVYYAADMQTHDTERHDKSQAFTSQQNTIAANDTINEDTKL